MTDQQATIYYTVFLGLALCVIPASYIALCVWMVTRRAHWWSYVAHFFLFGTVGGWCLAFGLSPSPLAALCLLFLLVTSPVCILTSFWLESRSNCNAFDRAAVVGGYVYLGLFTCGLLAASFFA